MGLIFISHSSSDNAEAVAMRDWLAMQGWEEVFLDLDPSAGLAPGQRWRDELRRAGERCAAVIALVSPHWAASRWCVTEFLCAAQLGKEIFPVLIAPCSFSELPVELTATYQLADISVPGKRAEGLEDLRIGLQRAGLHPGAFPWPPKDEPKRPIFRGLRVLEEKDAAIFFGRDVQITKALDAIRRLRDGAPERMLVILGASGAGKSSFLRAGLLARLKRDTERFLVLPIVRPGRAALTGSTGLWRALDVSGPVDDATITARFAELRAQPKRLRIHAARQVAGAAAIEPTVLLPIDQAEELFVAGDEEAAAAVALIVDAIRAEPGLLLLITIRSDSFGLLQGNPLLSGIPRLPFDLPRLPPAALGEIIEGPTRRPGAGVEIDADLPALLIQDFEGTDALPLLAFTLERLIADHGADGRIEKREYVNEMKGVGGAIRKAVEGAFAAAAEIPGLPRSRAELDALAQRAFVPGLVRIDTAAAAPKRRVALRRQLPQEALPLVDCLVDQRLLVTDTAGTERTVEVSHEAVLRHWRELERWIADRRDDLLLSERVMTAARDWRDTKGVAEHEALVHRGERLRAAEKLLLWDDLRRQIGDEAVAYLAACREAETSAEAAEEKKRQTEVRRTRTFGCVVFGLLCIATVAAIWAFSSQGGMRRTSAQATQTLRDQLATDDGALVLRSVDKLLSIHHKTVEEIVESIPRAKLRENVWLANLAWALDLADVGVLERLDSRPSYGREHEIRPERLAALPGVSAKLRTLIRQAVSDARGIGPPRSATQDENRLVQIKAGGFTMGSPAGVVHAQPAHKVRLSGFLIQEHEVTAEEYLHFDPYHNFGRDGSQPVMNVSWYDAMAYAFWIGGSLPTEAQWEFTARGESGRTYPWADSAQPSCDRAQFGECEGRLKPVRAGREAGKTPEGVFDLAGNVMEWCRDWYGGYHEDKEPPKDPFGPLSGSARVVRGGSYGSSPETLRAVERSNLAPGVRDVNLGFRVVVSRP